MREESQRPRARTSGLVVKELGDEVLVYDLMRHRAHSLNPAAAVVWRRLDGQTPVGELARALPPTLGGDATESTVWLALRDLERAHLLEEPLRVPAGQPVSRRQWLRRVGVAAGASAVLVPTVSTIVAPHAYAQASGCANPGCVQGSCAGGSGNCMCVATTEATACVVPCCTPTTCASSADCPANHVCNNTCCGAGALFCMPLCGQPAQICQAT